MFSSSVPTHSGYVSIFPELQDLGCISGRIMHFRPSFVQGLRWQNTETVAVAHTVHL